jgi:RHS repeat-associated protein
MAVRAQGNYLPTMKVLDGPAISPPNAIAYFNSATSTGTSISPATPPEIVELARGLGASDVVGGQLTGAVYAERVYEYIRQNIDTEFKYGLQKGALGALLEQSGTPFDQASLMIALLAQANVSGTFQAGTIGLTAQQVQNWTGLTNATAACKLFANGGIPVAINGSTPSNCIIGGTVTSAQINHIWVSALGSYYDPSFKRYQQKTGIDIANAMGCGNATSPTCGTSAISAATPANIADQAPIGGAPAWKNVRYATLAGTMSSFGSNLQSYLRTNLPSAVLSDVVGGSSIDWSSLQPAGSTLPYSTSQVVSWSAIPSVYRTTLRVQFDNIDTTMFVDEIYGSRLKIFGTIPATTGTGAFPVQRTVGLYLEYRLLASSTRSDGTIYNTTLTLSANHPYAASGGTYADESVPLNTVAQLFYDGGTYQAFSPLTIIHGWGDVGPASLAHMTALQSAGMAQMNLINPTDPNHTITATGTNMNCWSSKLLQPNLKLQIDSSGTTWSAVPQCLGLQLDPYAANWLLQESRAAKVIKAVNSVFVQTHHVFGWTTSCTGCGTSMSLEYTRSVYSNSASSADRQAAMYSLAAAASRLEGSLAEQTFDAYDGGSAISLAHRSNDQSIPLMELTAANYSTASAQLQNYPSSVLSYFSAYMAPPYNYVFVVPQNYALGSFPVQNGAVVPETINGYSGFSPAGDQIGYEIGADAQKGAENTDALDPLKDTEQALSLADYSGKSRKYLSVDAATGNLTLSAPPDIVTGTGGFPFSLSFSRSFSSVIKPPDTIWGGCTSYPFASTVLTTCSSGNAAVNQTTEPGTATLGHGWTHNLQISLSMGSDVLQALGEDSALDAAGTIATAYVLRNLYSGTQAHPMLVTGMFVTDWWANSLRNNAVVIQEGFKRKVFIRNPDGVTFNPPPTSAAVLSQSGSGVGPYYGGGTFLGYDYSGVTFSLIRDDGSQMTFSRAFPALMTPPGATPNGLTLRAFKPDTWTFPSGVSLQFAYSASAWNESGTAGIYIPQYACLSRVSNNLGRAINFTSQQPTWLGDTCLVQSVSDENNARTFTWTSAVETVANVAARTPDGSTTTYNYSAAVFPTTTYGHQLGQIVMPGDSSAFESLGYDSLMHVRTLNDGLGNQTNFYSSGFLAEQLGRGETRDPSGAFTTIYKDFFGNTLQQIDPLNRVTSYAYDGRSRLVTKTYPELNYDTYSYDVRSNLLSTTRYPKPGTGFAPLTSSASYYEAAGVATCAHPATCNRRATTTDAAGQLTTYTYLSSGQLERVLGPVVTAQTGGISGQSQVDYCYTSYPANSGYASSPYALTSGSISMPSGKITKVDASTNRVVSFAYNTVAGNLTLQSATVDPATTLIPPSTAGGGCTAATKTTPAPLSLVTRFTYDNGAAGPGNVTQKIDPNTNQTGFAYDSMRRLTAISAPLGALTRYCFDAVGDLVSTNRARASTSDPNLATESTSGQCPNAFSSSSWQSEARTYFITGDLRTVTDANGNITTYAYDPEGRQQVVQDGDGRQTASLYDAAGQLLYTWRGGTNWLNTSTGTPAIANIPTTWTPSSYTAAGPLRYAAYTYNANGTRQAATDADGNTTQYTYDGFDRLTQSQYQDGLTEKTWYTSDGTSRTGVCSPSGQPCRKINRAGNYVSYAYDQMDREMTRTPQLEGAYTYGYNLVGEQVAVYKLASGSLPGHSTLFGYDGAGRRTTETNDGQQVGSSFDSNGNRTGITWPDLYHITYQYDALNRMTYALQNGSTELAYYDYDTLSHRNYSCFGGQSSACQSGGGTNKVVYAYEADGDISSIDQVLNSASVTQGFGHNHSHQITSVSATDNFYLTIPGATASVAYVPSQTNKYASVAGNTLQYDGNGNLKTLFPSTGAQTFTYDSENRLIKAAVNGSPTPSNFYDYDALERRVSKTAGGTALHTGGTTTNYLLDGDQEIAELDASGSLVRRYIPGPSADERIAVAEGGSTTAPILTYFHANHQGSVLAMTDSAGNAVSCAQGVNCQRLAYDEYGILSTSATTTGEVYRYTGRSYDQETGLYYSRARYYAPSIGRFLQTDPVGSKDDLNAYLYVHGDPMNFVDHNGKWPTEIHESIIDHAFPGLSEHQRETLKSVSAGMDHCLLCQAEAWSYKHSMKYPSQSVAEAKKQTQEWVKQEENYAKENQGGTPKNVADINDSSLSAFGDAAHTVADGTSPAHVDPNGDPLPWSPYTWSGVKAHEKAEGTISPEQMQKAVDALRAAFSDTYGPDAEQQAETPPQQPSPPDDLPPIFVDIQP